MTNHYEKEAFKDDTLISLSCQLNWIAGFSSKFRVLQTRSFAQPRLPLHESTDVLINLPWFYLFRSFFVVCHLVRLVTSFYLKCWIPMILQIMLKGFLKLKSTCFYHCYFDLNLQDFRGYSANPAVIPRLSASVLDILHHQMTD